jgi:hypothetical protein
MRPDPERPFRDAADGLTRCFAAPGPVSERVRWVLREDETKTHNGTSWPDKTTNGFLEFE